VAKAKLRVNAEQSARLRSQLMLASSQQAIRQDQVLLRLVRRASHRLQFTGDSGAVARQIGVDIGYYLFCHEYQMPREAYELLAVAQLVATDQTLSSQLISLPSRTQ